MKNKYQQALDSIKNLRTGGSSVEQIKGVSLATIQELVERREFDTSKFIRITITA